MRRFCFQALLSAAVWVSLCGLAAAKGHGGDHGHGGGNSFAGNSHDHGDHDRDRDRDRDHHFADHDRDHHEAGPSKRPSGWDKGKKTGWGNCNEPPGLAKKNGGCGSRGHHDHDVHTAHHDTHHTTTAQSQHHTWPWHHDSNTGSSARTTTHTTTSASKPTGGSGVGVRGGARTTTHVQPNRN